LTRKGRVLLRHVEVLRGTFTLRFKPKSGPIVEHVAYPTLKR